MTTTWQQAAGSCSLNIGDTPIEAAYVNGVALFAYESPLSRPEAPFFQCVVTGHMTCGGDTLEAAKQAGEARAIECGREGADRHVTKREFDALAADPTRLPNQRRVNRP